MVITWFLVVLLNLADFAYSVSWQVTSHPSSKAFSLDRVEGDFISFSNISYKSSSLTIYKYKISQI